MIHAENSDGLAETKAEIGVLKSELNSIIHPLFN